MHHRWTMAVVVARSWSLAGLGLGLALACVPKPRVADPPSTATAERAEPPEPEPEESTVPEPTPLVEISAAAMAPVRAEPVEHAFADAELKRIRAVQGIVAAAAAEHGVDPALINGLIWVESKFEARARGPAGAQGLMQLMPKTAAAMAKRLGRKRASHDPDFNIHAGTLLLSRLLDRFDGDEALALAAYNRGTGIVAGWVAAGEPLPGRTQAFVDRVLEARTWFAP